ncbi:MAG: pyridoxal 5'-phosphate synthase glutaminase subunit PdxT [Thermoplasmata archaeon]
MSVGVLALQGDVPEHLRALAQGANGRPVVAVRSPADLARIEALFLPGGESTTIARLLHDTRLWEPLRARLQNGLPVLATCAGLILLARHLAPSASGRDPPTFGMLDVTVRRNDYGSQADSFEELIRVDGLGQEPFPGVFIRAPRILSVGPEAAPIAWRGSEIVGVRGGRLWGLTFHPELSNDLRLHRRFLSEIPP